MQGSTFKKVIFFTFLSNEQEHQGSLETSLEVSRTCYLASALRSYCMCLVRPKNSLLCFCSKFRGYLCSWTSILARLSCQERCFSIGRWIFKRFQEKLFWLVQTREVQKYFFDVFLYFFVTFLRIPSSCTDLMLFILMTAAAL